MWCSVHGRIHVTRPFNPELTCWEEGLLDFRDIASKPSHGKTFTLDSSIDPKYPELTALLGGTAGRNVPGDS